MPLHAPPLASAAVAFSNTAAGPFDTKSMKTSRLYTYPVLEEEDHTPSLVIIVPFLQDCILGDPAYLSAALAPVYLLPLHKRTLSVSRYLSPRGGVLPTAVQKFT